MDRNMKRRRIHKDMIECASFAASEEGSKALTAPSTVRKSSKDVNRGLYPRPSKSISSSSCASSSCYASSSSSRPPANEEQANTSAVTDDNPSKTSIFMTGAEYYAINSHKFKRRKTPSRQNYSLLNYFQNTEDKSLSPENAIEVNSSGNKETEDIFLQSLLSEEIKCQDSVNINSENRITDDCIVISDDDGGFEDIYGMLGIKNEDHSQKEVDCGPDYFQVLPTHVFELILCQLPFLDLMLTLKRVSKSWNEVISNENFLQWKKRYFTLKTGKCKETEMEIHNFCISAQMDNIWNCLLGLVKFMKSFNLTPSSDMIDNMKSHKKYQWAEDMLKDRAPECIINGIPNPWCMVAALVVISATVWDIYDILRSLLHIHSQCPIPDILECLYCIATFLFHFKNVYKINVGIHYRLYYALYIYENKWKGKVDDIKTLQHTVKGQQSIIKYSMPGRSIRFTHEQMHIVNHELQPRQIIKIVAFAGTGKTSTLIEFTKLRPHMRFLNVMYNKSVCDHAKRFFPCNVECRTAHSLAWAAIGKRYFKKLVLKIKPLDIVPLLKRAPSSVTKKFQYAHSVLITVETFMSTADTLITTAHVPTEVSDREGNSRTLDYKERLDIASDAECLWKMMTDLNNPASITHDVYLKLYQLNSPDLSHYDCILIDEAQDCNGAMLNILLSQPCPKILVGDPNQQIYAFRGALNALDGVQSTHTYYLTQSFRFGPEISYIASCALEVLKGIKNKTLVGGMQLGSTDGRIEGQLSIIARSNVTLFNEAVRLCCTDNIRNGEPRNVLGTFAGGIKGYGLDQIADIYKLMSLQNENKANSTNVIKDKFVQRFSKFADLHRYAKGAEDTDLLGKIKLVLQHREKIPEYIEKIKQKCSYPLDMANVVFTTAHKSKGLEFDTVCIMDDFTVGNVPYVSDVLSKDPQYEDEFNILYVAITRAKKCLCIPVCVYFMLLGAQEKFEYLHSRRKLQEAATSTVLCYFCGQNVFLNNENPFVLIRKELRLSSSTTVAGGTMCERCATNPVFIPMFPNPNSALQIRRPIEDYAHKSVRKLVGSNLSEEKIRFEQSREDILHFIENVEIWEQDYEENLIFLV